MEETADNKLDKWKLRQLKARDTGRATERKNAAQLACMIQTRRRHVVYLSLCYATYHSTRGSSPSPLPPPPAAAIDVSSLLERGCSKPPLGSGCRNIILLVWTTSDAVPWDGGIGTNAVVARHPRRITDAVAIAAVKSMSRWGCRASLRA